MVSKTRACAGPRPEDRMIGGERERNALQVHAVSHCHEQIWKRNRPVRWPRKMGEAREAPHCLDTEIRLKRYRKSVIGQGQGNLDTNQEVVGRKTGKGALPTQEMGQRGYSHHAW
jgi:hypothetical protein